MNPHSALLRNWFPVAFLIAVAGCGQKEPLARVSGTVTFEGEPVAEALVIFSGEAQGTHMTAKVVDGKYTVKRAKAKGIPPGDYRVAVSPPIEDHPVGPILEPPKRTRTPNIPERYHRPETSGLRFTLVDGDNTVDVAMTAK